MGLRVAEIYEEPVAQILRNMAFEPSDDGGGGVLVGANDIAHLLGVEGGGERRRSDEIAEHDGELAAFGLRGSPSRLNAQA